MPKPRKAILFSVENSYINPFISLIVLLRLFRSSVWARENSTLQ
ncbi:secreted protein [Candidatus Magnetoovum chiemensis]|nr:secreted protein [Candidatus Magnetoovum chiemensis]